MLKVPLYYLFILTSLVALASPVMAQNEVPEDYHARMVESARMAYESALERMGPNHPHTESLKERYERLVNTERIITVKGAFEAPSSPDITPLETKHSIAKVNALLLTQIGHEQNYGASVSELTCTITPSGAAAHGMITKTNQFVGQDMATSFAAVNRALYLKNQAWPKGVELEIGFEDKHGLKSGPSAALAYGLLLESIFSGKELRDDFACTGDMNSDTSVQPIGGVVDKIRAAKKEGCQFVLIPESNVTDVYDAALDGELELLSSIQIITVTNLEDAIEVAFKDSNNIASEKIASYGDVQKVIKKNGVKMLKNSKVFQRVAEVGKAIPNHLTARIVAQVYRNKLPPNYSVVGSFVRLDKAVKPFTTTKHSRGSVRSFDKKDSHTETISNLKNLSRYIHPNMEEYNQAILEYIEAHRSAVAQKRGISHNGTIAKRLNRAKQYLKEVRSELLEDDEIKDALAQ